MSPKKELHATSVARQLKSGGMTKIKDCRVSAAAVEAAKSAAEGFLTRLAAKCMKILNMTGRKRVDKDLLLKLLEEGCHRQSIYDEAQQGMAAGRTKKDREPIAVESVVRVFGKRLPLGRKAHQVSEDAKYVLAKAVRVYIVELGAQAAGYTHAGGRTTIKASDVAAATSCMSR